jgi:hypothetical protein
LNEHTKKCPSIFFSAGSGTCLWSKNAPTHERFNYPIGIEALPLPKLLKEEIQQLVLRYDQFIDWSNPGGPSPWNKSEKDEFDAWVERVILRLREELGDDFLLLDQYTRLANADF